MYNPKYPTLLITNLPRACGTCYVSGFGGEDENPEEIPDSIIKDCLEYASQIYRVSIATINSEQSWMIPLFKKAGYKLSDSTQRIQVWTKCRTN